MVQGTSNINPQVQSNLPSQKGDKPVKKQSHFHENLARQFVIESCFFSIFIPAKLAVTFAGIYASAALIDHHGESIGYGLGNLASAAKSAGQWIGERIDQVLLAGTQEEGAVKVESVKSQIFNK